MTNRKPVVLGDDGGFQQVQSTDQVDPVTLPYNVENSNSRLIRLILRDLLAANFPLSRELLDELSKPT